MMFKLITYGAGDILHTTFNAIATVLNGSSGTLYQPLARIGLIVGLLWATCAMIYGEKSDFLHKWVFPLTLALTLFFAPTCRVLIVDPVKREHFSVDNVPWGLGATASLISQIGDGITREIERVFSLPDDLKYHKTGSALASHLIAASRTFRITNADLSETLRSFMNQCVIYDALLGRKYTFHDLKNAPNLWALATREPSPARCFLYKAPGKGQAAQIVTCQKGAQMINDLFQKELPHTFKLFGVQVFGKRALSATPPSVASSSVAAQAGTAAIAAELKRYLPQAFNHMTGMAETAEDIMRQQIMIHGLADAIEAKSTGLGNASRSL